MWPLNLSGGSSDESIKEAGLDFTVSKHPVVVNNITFKNHFCTMRNDEIPLGIVKGSYKVYQNSEAFKGIDSIREEFGLKYVGGGTLGRGERVYLVAELPRADFTVVDNHRAHIVMLNSHDGTTGIKVIPVDRSKYVYAMEGYSVKHAGNLEKKMEEAYSIIGLSLEEFGKYGETLAKLYEVPFDPYDYCRDVVFNFSNLDPDENEITWEDLDKFSTGKLRSAKKKFIETTSELVDVVEAAQGVYGKNAYGAFMGVLEYCNGRKYNGNDLKKFETKFNSILLGKMRKFQGYALPLLCKYVEEKCSVPALV